MTRLTIITLLTAFLLFGQQSRGQSTFNWTDTTFLVSAKRTINILYDIDGPCSVNPCYESRDNHFAYDTLINFLKTHPSIKIEIASHLDFGKDISINFNWSQRKADYMKEVLIEKGGISADRIIAIGYGNKKQIITEEKIAPLDKYEQEMARKMNTRIEIIIIGT